MHMRLPYSCSTKTLTDASYLAPGGADILPLIPQQTPTRQSAFTPKHPVVSLSLCVWFLKSVFLSLCVRISQAAQAPTTMPG